MVKLYHSLKIKQQCGAAKQQLKKQTNAKTKQKKKKKRKRKQKTLNNSVIISLNLLLASISDII